jgi:hypothetical protein
MDLICRKLIWCHSNHTRWYLPRQCDQNFHQKLVREDYRSIIHRRYRGSLRWWAFILAIPRRSASWDIVPKPQPSVAELQSGWVLTVRLQRRGHQHWKIRVRHTPSNRLVKSEWLIDSHRNLHSERRHYQRDRGLQNSARPHSRCNNILQRDWWRTSDLHDF